MAAQPSNIFFSMGISSLGCIAASITRGVVERLTPPIIIAPLSLAALLASLLAQYAYPVKGRQPLLAFYGRMCLSTAKRLNAGDRNSGILAWFALVGAILVPVALLTALLAAIHPFLVWLLDIAVL